MTITPDPIHVIGGGLAGSEAAWQIAESGLPVVVHEMRPGRGTEAHRTDRLAELVCSNSFRSDDAESNAVGLLHEEMPALRLARHGGGGRTQGTRRRRAGRRPGRFRGAHNGAPRRPPAGGDRARRGRRPAARGLGLGHRCHRTLDLAGAERRHRGAHRRGQPGLLRRHRPHRPSRQHRFRPCLVPAPLRQARPRRQQQGLHQLPLGPITIPGLRAGPARFGKDGISGLGARHPVFRGLPCRSRSWPNAAWTRCASGR